MNLITRIHDYDGSGVCKDCCALDFIAIDSNQHQCPLVDVDTVRLNNQYFQPVYRRAVTIGQARRSYERAFESSFKVNRKPR